MRRRLIAVLALAVGSAPLLAQSPPAGPRPVEPPFAMLESLMLQANPGQAAVVEGYFLKLRAAEATLKVPGTTEVYVVAQGGRAGHYQVFRSLRSWGDLDVGLERSASETLTRAYGEAAAEQLSTALRGATQSLVTEVMRVLPGRSTWRDNAGQAWPYIEVRRTNVRPERVAQHDEFQERIRAVRASAGTTPEVRLQVALGPGFVFVTARYFKTWADRDTWQDELAKAYGQPEADRLINSWRQTLLDTENYVLRHRPELSRVRIASATSKP